MEQNDSEKVLSNELQDILFYALQTSYVDSVIVHKIDNENSAIEMDYHAIANAIIDAIESNGYTISKVELDQE